MTSTASNCETPLETTLGPRETERTRGVATDRVSVLWSDGVEDQGWDEFLQSIPLGQFQQAGVWSRYKTIDGWHPLRGVLVRDGVVTGGFQLLWRRSRWGRIGYVSKGPVLRDETPELSELAAGLLRHAAEKLKLTAVIAQPPDRSQLMSAALSRNQFVTNHVRGVIRATLVVDLSEGIQGVERGFSKSTRTEIRQARRRGVVVREGGAGDISSLFNMIQRTCQRQGVQPHPASERELAALWRAFHAVGAARLTIAQCSGQDVAGQLCLVFGDRISIWKNGWTGEHSGSHPNRLLTFEALQWACSRGCKSWDWVALEPAVAAARLASLPLTEEQKQGQHFFRLCFGGAPMLLPESQIWIRHPVLRLGYRLYGWSRKSLRPQKKKSGVPGLALVEAA